MSIRAMQTRSLIAVLMISTYGLPCLTALPIDGLQMVDNNAVQLGKENPENFGIESLIGTLDPKMIVANIDPGANAEETGLMVNSLLKDLRQANIPVVFQ